MAPKSESILIATWSELPVDVLDRIFRRLDLPVDVVSFGGVCKLWRYVALEMHMISLYYKLPIYHCVPKRNPLPMLLHPGCKGSNIHSLYSLNEQKIYDGLHLQELSNKWIVGSGAGWLVTVHTVDSEVTLLNPLIGKKIALPHLSVPLFDWSPSNKDSTTYWYIRKVILCSYQGSVLAVALVSHLKAIRFCKIGDTEWTRLENSPIYVDDIIMHNGKLYAINRSGALFEIDIADPAKMTMVAMSRNIFPGGGKRFIVNLCGEMVQLERVLWKFGTNKESGVTYGFKVYKLVEEESGYSDLYQTETGTQYQEKASHSWVRLGDLGHHLVFIGYNHSVSLDSRVYPACKGSCIYFADNRIDEFDQLRMRGIDKELCHDVGVYHIVKHRVNHFKQFSKAPSPMNMVWLSPNFSSEPEMQMLPQ